MRIGRPIGVMFSLRGLMSSAWQKVQNRSATPTGRFVDVVAAVAGGADDLAAADAAAGQGHAERPRIVVAAGVGVDARRAAELAHPDHQRPVEQAAFLQVAAPGPRSPGRPARSGACTRSKLSWCVSQPFEVDLDERDARLDQPAGQQAALAERRCRP